MILDDKDRHRFFDGDFFGPSEGAAVQAQVMTI